MWSRTEERTVVSLGLKSFSASNMLINCVLKTLTWFSIELRLGLVLKNASVLIIESGAVEYLYRASIPCIFEIWSNEHKQFIKARTIGMFVYAAILVAASTLKRWSMRTFSTSAAINLRILERKLAWLAVVILPT